MLNQSHKKHCDFVFCSVSLLSRSGFPTAREAVGGGYGLVSLTPLLLRLYRRFTPLRLVNAAPATVFLVALLALSAAAQQFPGRIAGSVRDPQGGAVPGAQVRLSNPAIGMERIIVTDESGYFNFPELPLSSFTITVTKTGFQTFVQKDIVTVTGQVNEVSAQLQVGAITSLVEVNAVAPLVQTETNNTGGTLNDLQVGALPIGNSDYSRLALILPGVVQNSNFAQAQYSINGSREHSVSFNIDGATNTDPNNGLPSVNQGGNSATGATRLPLDAIQEVSVISSGGADVGQSSGGVMNAIVKSGTNKFHGSLYELHRDASLDAHNFFENLGGIPKAPFIWNEFGGSAGGPVYIPKIYNGKDKTFIFGAYDVSRLKLGTTFSSRAPSSAQIQQATALLAAKGITPNPLAVNILQLYQPLSGQFVVNNQGLQRPNSFAIKVDHRFSPSDSLSARYLYGNGDDEFPTGSPGAGGGSQLAEWFGVTTTTADNFAISEVHIFSPQLLNTLRLGYNLFAQYGHSRDYQLDPTTIGFNTGVGPLSFGVPEIDVGAGAGRFVNLGKTAGNGGRTSETIQAGDDVSFTHGRHALKFGANLYHNYLYGTTPGSRGLFTFDGTQLGNTMTADGGLAGLIDLLAGLPKPGSTTITRGDSGENVTQNLISAYALDTFNWTNNFTLTYGLNYAYMGTPNELHGHYSNFDPAVGLVILPPGQPVFQRNALNFGPRVAIAWKPPFSIGNHQTVFRAGWGLYFDTMPLGVFNALTRNPIGAAPVFTITPTAPIPFGVNVPTFGAAGSPPKPPFNLTAIDPHISPQNVMNWNLNVQQELHTNVVLQVGYVGTHGRDLFQLLDVNFPTPGSAATAQQRRPYFNLYPTYGKISTIESVGWSNYHSMQVTLRSSNFHGLTSQVSYTWSHNLDTGSATSDYSGTSGFVPADPRNLGGSYGNSEFDQRNAFIFSYAYYLPSPKINNWLASGVLNGWILSGTTTARAGLASPVLASGGPSGTLSNRERPDCVGPIHYQLSDLTKPYVTSGLVAPAAGTFGTCPRDPIVAPGLYAWDISLGKTFKVTERLNFEFGAAFFNAFNHPNFAQPSPDLSTRISATADDGSFDSHFGVGGPRNIQVRGRITW